VAATTLARAIPGADVPAPNLLSAMHLGRIAGGLLYAATSNVPWATLLARTFEVDVKVCARCGGWLDVRAVVTDHEVARNILDAMPSTARAPPPSDSSVVNEPAFAEQDREPMPTYARRTSFRRHLSAFLLPCSP
jgi:hypothetical protein